MDANENDPAVQAWVDDLVASFDGYPDKGASHLVHKLLNDALLVDVLTYMLHDVNQVSSHLAGTYSEIARQVASGCGRYAPEASLLCRQIIDAAPPSEAEILMRNAGALLAEQHTILQNAQQQLEVAKSALENALATCATAAEDSSTEAIRSSATAAAKSLQDFRVRVDVELPMAGYDLVRKAVEAVIGAFGKRWRSAALMELNSAWQQFARSADLINATFPRWRQAADAYSRSTEAHATPGPTIGGVGQ